MIPATVALFDDYIMDRDGLTRLHRYTLARLRCTTGISQYDIFRIQNTLGGPIECVEGRETQLGKCSFAIYPGTVRWDSKIWMTGQIVRINGKEFPVVDFEYRAPFRDWEYPMKLDGDTVDACRRRQTVQIHRRIAIIRAAATPETAPKAAPSPGKIPMFVARLVKENAIASKDICPISQNPFSNEAPAALLECFHLFEPDSIHQWIAMKKECPVCKVYAKTTLII